MEVVVEPNAIKIFLWGIILGYFIGLVVGHCIWKK